MYTFFGARGQACSHSEAVRTHISRHHEDVRASSGRQNRPEQRGRREALSRVALLLARKAATRS
eukprot:scaffold510050_cov47-Prasinocladus_malaysianus.AAC.1